MSNLPPLLDLMGVTEAAIKAATERADKAEAGWSDAAYDVLRAFVAKNGNAMFKADDVRLFGMEHGFSCPTDNRAWGSVFRRAAKDKLIRRSGYAPTSALGAHSRPVTIWKKY